MTDLDPAALVRATHRGDPRAAEALLRWLRPHMLAFARRQAARCHDPATDPDDLTQLTCLDVLTAIRAGTVDPATVLTFARAVATRRAVDIHRRRHTLPYGLRPELDVPDGGPGPERVVLRAELVSDARARVEALLRGLTPTQRRVLYLRFGLGMTTAETATALGMTPGGVRVAQCRGIQASGGTLAPPEPRASALRRLRAERVMVGGRWYHHDAPHGTDRGYSRYGCHCGPCRAAGAAARATSSERAARWRADRRAAS